MKKPKMSRIHLLVLALGLVLCSTGALFAEISFFDDFEKGIGNWDLISSNRIMVIDSGDTRHGKVLALYSGGESVYALIKGSNDWANLALEADVYFPDESAFHYLGLIYHYRAKPDRVDFGSIFLLGPYGEDFENYYQAYRKNPEQVPDQASGNVILPNPHRDANASRLLYSEFFLPLTSGQWVKPREWHHLKAEIVGPACHCYVDDMKTPKLTMPFFEYSSGQVGFKPRFVGTPVWVDHVKATSIRELSYKGPLLPGGVVYKPEKLLTQWDILGPFNKRSTAAEGDGFLPVKTYKEGIHELSWQPFAADGRGCMVAGRVISRFNGKWLVYFHTVIQSDTAREATLEFSTCNPMLIWNNRTLVVEVKAQFTVWPDFLDNPAHAGEKVKVTLAPGENHLVVLLRGGRYGGDGFYAALHPATEK